MKEGLLTLALCILCLLSTLEATNPDGDLRIEMLDYYNLVVDHNIHSPTGASPRAVYIGVRFCNDGANPLEDVYAHIGDFTAGTPGIYPVETVSSGPYTGSFSFTHEGGTADATRYIGTLAPGECVVQYWLLSYPLLDANNNRVTGSKPDPSDDLRLRYDVWATAKDNGTPLAADDSKTLQLRAVIAANANKIWPNTTSKVPNELLAAYPDKELGWRQTSNTTHPGASVVLEGIWFDLGNVGQGFDNDGDFVPDRNFLLQPVGNPGVFDANCFRLVKVWGLVALKRNDGDPIIIEFEDQMHFANNPETVNGGVGMIYYEFAVLNGPCSSQLTPYQEVASGMNEKYNGDYGLPGGTINSNGPQGNFTKTAPATVSKGSNLTFTLSFENTDTLPLGLPQYGSPLVIEDDVPANTVYVAGSATANLNLPPGVSVEVLYSTDNGTSWDATEPNPASSVNKLQWVFTNPLPGNQTASVDYTVTVAPNYLGNLLTNTAGVSIRGGAAFLTASSNTVINGSFNLTSTVFKDDGGGLQGNGDYYATQVLGSYGVSNTWRALGAPDGQYVQLYDSYDYIILDLGQTIPAGQVYQLVWRRKPSYSDNGSAEIRIYEGVTCGNHIENPFRPSTTSKTDFVTTNVVANTDTRFIILEELTGSGDDFELDAVVIPTGVFADGIQNGSEEGIPGVKVEIFLDVDSNSVISEADVLADTVLTDANGEFSFANLPDGKYIITVDTEDPDLPERWTNTTPLTVPFTSNGGGTLNADFGFAPLLELTNTLQGPASVFENEQVSFTVDLKNRSQAEDSDNSSTVIAWAGAVDPSTTYNVNTQNMTGPPDDQLGYHTGSWDKKAVLKNFDFGPQNGTIEKVEILFSLCTDYPVNNDRLQASIQLENGQTVVFPDPAWGKSTSPSLNDYVGVPYLGFIVVDITQYQNWDWSFFDPEWKLTIEGIKVGGSDGAHVYIDAVGVRVTTVCCPDPNGTEGEPASRGKVIERLPLEYEFDNSKLKFVSASQLPDSVVANKLYFNDLGPLYPAQTKSLTIDFQTVKATTATCNTTAPQCNSVPNAYNYCGIPNNGYYRDVTINGDVNWADILPDVDPTYVNKFVRIRGSGKVTLPSGNLRVLNYNSLLVVDGPELVVLDGDFLIEEGGCAIFSDAILRTKGNITMTGNTLLCFHDCTIECGDEAANGFFNPTGVATLSNFTNNQGQLYLNNVCMNVTGDFRLESGNNGENILINVCAEIGDMGENHHITGILDAGETGVFRCARNMEVYNSEIVASTGVINDPTGTLLLCGTDIKTMNGDFQNSGYLDGCNNTIWVDDAHQIQQLAGTWTANIFSRRGALFGDIPNMPPNEPESSILNNFSDCQCVPLQEQICVDGTTTTARSDQALNGDGLLVNVDEDPECVEILNKGAVRGYVFADKDGDGWQGEYGYESNTDYFLEGVVVEIYGCKKSNGDLITSPGNSNKPCTHNQNGGTWDLMATDTTDANGAYELRGLPDGYYYAKVLTSTVPGLNGQTADPDQTNGQCSTCDSEWKSDNDKMKNLAIVGIGNDHYEINFGYTVDEIISGFIWEDLDGDGVWDEGEVPLPGVTVICQDGTCTPGVDCPTAVTGPDGQYEFTGVPPGQQCNISVDMGSLPGGLTWTIPSESDGSNDNNISLIVGPGEQSNNNNFALHPAGNATISGLVYYDWLGNAFPNAGDEGIPNVYVRLYSDLNADGIVQRGEPLNEMIQTDSSGLYQFSGVRAGNYVIVVDEGSLPIFPAQTEDPDEFAICVICDGRATAASIDGSSNYPGFDFGYKVTGEGTVRGYVFFDENANGYPGAGEPPLAGIEVQIEANLNLDTAYVLIFNGVSGGLGTFTFSGLPDGTYRIRVNQYDEDLPLDGFGERAIPSTSTEVLATLDNGKLTAVNGVSCGSCPLSSIAFGFTMAGTVESYIFRDDNANGTMDLNETGIAGVQVCLCEQSNQPCTLANAIDTVTVADGTGTDPIGMFRFTGLRPGYYDVAVVTSTLPSGMVLTADPSTDGIPCYSPLDPNDPNYDILNAGCDNRAEDFWLGMGAMYAGVNFGYRPLGVIGDLVWLDVNGNGTKDPTENGYPNMSVALTNLTGVTIGGQNYGPNTYHDTTYTDADGFYTFGNLPDGTWQVKLLAPANHVSTYEPDGSNDFSMDVVIFQGSTTSNGNAWCPAGNDCDLDVDFGLRPNYTHSISGTICFDLDEDGRCNTGGESFPEGVSVYLYDQHGTFFGQVTPVSNGYYEFLSLPPDTFTVSVGKSGPPLSLTSMTTSLGDTPAFEVGEAASNAYQKLSVAAQVTDVDFGFSFSEPFDLGDLPAPYPTQIAGSASGPVHRIPTPQTLYLGAGVDAENVPVLQADALGDDSAGADEDGVVFSDPATWTVGSVASGNGGSANITVTGSGWLVGFADFNNDGDFGDAGELVANQAVSSGTFTLNFDIPFGTSLEGGEDYYFRFRLLPDQPMAPTFAFRGVAVNGEVEDYRVSVCKNITSAGAITGNEIGCNGYDPGLISESAPPSGGGGTLEYRWEQSTNGGITWNIIPGAEQATYDPPAITQTTHYRRCVRRSRCSAFTNSMAVIKEVVTNYTDAGIIVGNEENCGIYDPGIIASALEPSGGVGVGTEEYVWQKSTDGGATWTNILNSNSDTYDPGVINQTTMYRRGARKSPCLPWLWSNTVTKMVVVNFTDAGSVAGDESVCGPYDPGLISSVSAASGGLEGWPQYQWELSTDGGLTWTDIPGATGLTHDPVFIIQTTQYRRKARRSPCASWVNSNVVTKTVKTIPAASIQTYPSGTLCEGEAYSFEAADAGAGVAYTWSFDTYATPLTAVGAGPHSVSYDVPDNVLNNGQSVILNVTKLGCGSSDTVQLTIRPEITLVGVDQTDPSVCGATDGQLVIHADLPPGGTADYSIDGGLTWQTDSTFTGLGAGIYEVAVRYSGALCSENLGAFPLSDPPPSATLSVSTSETCTGTVVTFQATPGSGSPSFSWTFGNGATPNSATGAGPHDVTFANGGPATIALTITEGACTGFLDTTIYIVSNFTSGGTILADQELCSVYDPAPLVSGSSPSGGVGGTITWQWEKREKDNMGVWSAWSEIAGATSETYDPPAIATMTEYRRKVRRAPCSNWLYSNTVQMRLIQKPDLQDDFYDAACPGFPYTANVGANDLNLVDPVFSLLVPPVNGTLDFEPDGEFIYQPNTTYCGTDEFTYVVCNEQTGCCDTAQVVIDLSDNELPVIQNVPADITISCDDQTPLAEAVEVFENCQTVSLGLEEISTQGLDSCSLHSYTMLRVWSSSDYCSNAATDQQVITIQDNTAPDLFRIYTLPNGKKMVAGVMENVSQLWKTVKMPIQFSVQPILLTQLVSANDTIAANVKVRNVSTTQFQMRIAEEEGQDGLHGVESVAWVAIEPGALNGAEGFEASSWLLTSIVSNQSFTVPFASQPLFIAAVSTSNEPDPITVRYSNLTGTDADIFLQEELSYDVENTHDEEVLSYLALAQAGNFVNNTGEVIGESGSLSLGTGKVTVTLQHTYHNPVVISGGISENNGEPVNVRVSNVTANSFDIWLEEWEYQDGAHPAEQVNWLVVEGSLPFDQTLECDAVPPALSQGYEIVAVDNCDQTVELVIVDDAPDFNCASDTIYTRTYSIVDDCGNTTNLTRTFILRDTTPPQFTVPADKTILCDANIADLTLMGDVTDETDNCASGLEATYSDDLSAFVNCQGFIVRTWTLTDLCGNTTTKVQNIFVAPTDDFDNDGVVDYFDHDDDNDGIPDLVEGTGDTDGDGVPDYQDRDSDNDGIPDLIEAGYTDKDGDGVIDIVGTPGWDHDGDGMAYGYDGNDGDPSEQASAAHDPGSFINDRDQDGIPNYRDLDSDNDGLPDIIEAGGIDTNGDGLIDYPVPGNPASMPDSDGDGFVNIYDSDDDLLPGAEDNTNPIVKYDGSEYSGGKPSDKPDYDGDAVPNFFDTDSDNDGIADLIESGGVDTDGDGKIDNPGEWTDANGDGIHDDYNNYPLIVTEGDLPPLDGRPNDINGDGSAYIGANADGDARPNFVDLDSDGDLLKDIMEAGLGGYDSNGDGKIDNWTDANGDGWHDLPGSSSFIITEDDGAINDGRPEDGTDADSTAYLGSATDGSFAMPNGNPDIDDDGDGIPNFLDTDSDNDNLPDITEAKDHNLVTSGTETNVFNPDTDGDGILDGIEDANQNGIVNPGETDPLNPNTDGDPLDDGEEDPNLNGLVDPGESDPRDPCDPYISDACVGVTLDIKVMLLGALVEVDTTGFMHDELRFQNRLPVIEPYSKLTFLHHIGDVPTGQTPPPSLTDQELVDPGLAFFTGQDAPVDWVLIELRPADVPDSIVATKAALLQRDGDVRDLDGISYVKFRKVRGGNYYVAVRHRNHLGVMTANPYLLTPDVTSIDFTDPNTPTTGSHSQSLYKGKTVMWPGDLNGDTKVIFQGPDNDVNALFQKVLLAPSNVQFLANFILPGYLAQDFNLDGKCIYQGPGNDRSRILVYAILANPENAQHLANYVLYHGLP
ncbi:MAG: hypothetical protein CMN32_10395 [Saprospirales bacterium]|nr:hypothetical protein [Saprospirales bacterium]